MTTGYARSFKDLRVYQKARQVSQLVFRLSRTFPKEEMYSLTDQLRRSARSMGAQIAEAWGKRRYEKHFVSSTKMPLATLLSHQSLIPDPRLLITDY